MERDFFGLSSKNGAGTSLKEDAANKARDPMRGSAMQWSFSNKASSSLPQFLSFKAAPEDRPRKSILDPLASSSGYMIVSTKDTFDSEQKQYSSVVQRNLSIGKQAGSNHGMAMYPKQCSDARSASRQEARMFAVSNQSNHASPVLQSNLTIARPNMVDSVIKLQPLLGSKSSGTPVSVLPPTSSIVGTTDLRNSSKSSSAPAQLTIFYGGSVCVYDDISPERAQAIMLLAGNGSAPSQNTVSAAKLQPAIPVPSKDDGFIISQSYPSPLPSTLPVTSLASTQPGGGSSSNNELSIIRQAGPSTTPTTSRLESPNVVGSIGSTAKKMVQTVGLPQARKASLARFLEKRKQRVMSTSPYYMSNKSPECSTPGGGSESISFSMNSSSSCPLPAVN